MASTMIQFSLSICSIGVYSLKTCPKLSTAWMYFESAIYLPRSWTKVIRTQALLTSLWEQNPISSAMNTTYSNFCSTATSWKIQLLHVNSKTKTCLNIFWERVGGNSSRRYFLNHIDVTRCSWIILGLKVEKAKLPKSPSIKSGEGTFCSTLWIWKPLKRGIKLSISNWVLECWRDTILSWSTNCVSSNVNALFCGKQAFLSVTVSWFTLKKINKINCPQILKWCLTISIFSEERVRICP